MTNTLSSGKKSGFSSLWINLLKYFYMVKLCCGERSTKDLGLRLWYLGSNWLAGMCVCVCHGHGSEMPSCGPQLSEQGQTDRQTAPFVCRYNPRSIMRCIIASTRPITLVGFWNHGKQQMLFLSPLAVSLSNSDCSQQDCVGIISSRGIQSLSCLGLWPRYQSSWLSTQPSWNKHTIRWCVLTCLGLAIVDLRS